MSSRTPAECYVYRKPDAQIPALQRSAMCNDTIYCPYGAGTLSRMTAICMLFLYRQICVFGVVLGLNFVASNLRNEPISCIEFTL